jgi:hypothetical protein
MMRDGLFLWGIHDALGVGDELSAPGERLSIRKKTQNRKEYTVQNGIANVIEQHFMSSNSFSGYNDVLQVRKEPHSCQQDQFALHPRNLYKKKQMI